MIVNILSFPNSFLFHLFPFTILIQCFFHLSATSHYEQTAGNYYCYQNHYHTPKWYPHERIREHIKK